MKAQVQQMCSGVFKVSYDIEACYDLWKQFDVPLNPKCSYCLINEGYVRGFDDKSYAELFANDLPVCSELLTSARDDKFCAEIR